MEEKLLIGSHVSMNAPEFYLGSVKEAISYGSTAFMFYTGAPQNSYRKPLSELKIQEGRKLLLDSGIDESKIIVHAPYIINAANKNKPDLWEMSIKTITSELKRTAGFNCKTLVLHPGNHVGNGFDVAIETLAEALDKVFEQDGTDVKIALETMCGKGTEIGINFEQIAKIIELSHHKDRLGVCLDTCHTSDYGYDLSDFDAILDDFDKIIGLDRLLVIHLNDSKNPRGAHKDRHENLGYGFIGFETLNKIAHNPRVSNIPKILETPYINEKPPYAPEIKMLKSGQFVENWKENF
ncbi:MAG: deoxyribonuclease IV [Bacilli bacterium]|nr:deoxyribonuclease IV [Bacilli bacterium]